MSFIFKHGKVDNCSVTAVDCHSRDLYFSLSPGHDEPYKYEELLLSISSLPLSSLSSPGTLCTLRTLHVHALGRRPGGCERASAGRL